MPIAQVQLEDGRIAEFEVPEGMTPQEIEAQVLQQLPPPKKSVGEAVGTAGEMAGGLVKGVGKGVLDIAGLVRSGLEQSGPGLVAKAAGLQLPWGDLNELADEYVPRPEGTAARYAYSVGEMVPGVAVGGGGLSAVEKVLMALGQGVGAEAGAKLTGDNPLGRMAGALAGGLPASLGAMRYRNAKELLADAMQGTSEADFKRAEALEGLLKELDMPYTKAQLFGMESSLPSLLQRVSEHPAVGPAMVKLMKSAPEKARALTDIFALQMGGAPFRRDVRTGLQEAAESALQGAKGKARAAYQAEMPLPFKYSQEKVRALYDSLLREADSYLPDSPQGSAIRDFASRLVRGQQEQEGFQWAAGPNGARVLEKVKSQIPEFFDDSDQLNNMYKAITVDAAKLPDNFKSLPMKEVRALWKQHTPEFQGARDAYHAAIQRYYDPMSRSLTGDVARAGGGPKADKTTARDALFNTVFPRGEGQPQQIAGLARDTAAHNKDAFSDFVAEHLRKSVGAALDKDFGAHGGVNAMAQSPAVLKDALVGSGRSGQSQNLETAFAEAAKAQGLQPRAVIKGFRNMMKAFETYSNVKLSNELSAMETARAGEKNWVGRVLSPAGRTTRAVDDLVRRKAYKEVAEILTSPDGLATLQQISKFSPWSGATQAALTQLLNAAAVTQGSVESQQVISE